MIALALALTAQGRPPAPTFAEGGCEGAANGAASWFVGDYTVEGDRVAGSETWVLVPNGRWRASGGARCSITWAITGDVVRPKACPTCDLGLKLRAEPSATAESCPDELVRGNFGESQSFEVRYDVVRGADGQATFRFTSGKTLAVGWHEGEALGFVSERQCKWF